MKVVPRCLLAAVLILGASQLRADTTLLPPGVQCWATPNGPLASGTVNTYIPSTSTPKTTWKDSGQAVTNTNPITLDANGCGIIFGTGSYRLLVKDSAGTQIYDVLTTDVSASNSVFWAALSGGTPNAITVVDAGFNSTPGSIITFKALNSNTGATTLSVSGSIATQIVKDTSTGPVALTGGEIIAGNVVSVLLDTIGAAWHLQNTVIASASGAAAPQCGVTGLVIRQNAVTPNTSIDVTWSSVTLLNTSGQVFSNSSPTTVTLNSTASGSVNQWDAARPTSNWGNIWLIGNGSTVGSLGSASATAPTMPSGYTYKCRVGAMSFNGAQNTLASIQTGSIAQYQVGGANVATLPLIANGITGTFSLTNPVLAAASVRGATRCSPPTATDIQVAASNNRAGGAASGALIAPSTAWGGVGNGPTGANNQVYPIWMNSGTAQGYSAWLKLESDNIATTSDAAGFAVNCLSWKDAVNAN